jgi:hypothetical protein
MRDRVPDYERHEPRRRSSTRSFAKSSSPDQDVAEGPPPLNGPSRAPPLAPNRPGAHARAWPEPEAPSAAGTDALWSAFEFDQSTPAEWDVGA